MTLRALRSLSVVLARCLARCGARHRQAFIDEDGALAADAATGLTAANMQSRIAVRRVNTTDTTMYGMDFVGRGVALGTGVTGTASIVRASSVADPPDDYTPDNVYRGASVTVQPTSGQLETRVEWHIGPHESLQYIVGWDLVIRPGPRALNSMPPGGPCDS